MILRLYVVDLALVRHVPDTIMFFFQSNPWLKQLFWCGGLEFEISVRSPAITLEALNFIRYHLEKRSRGASKSD